MTGTNSRTSVQRTIILQRVAELATTSALAVPLADRATPAKMTRRSAPRTADTKTAILCSMRPPSGGSGATGGDRWSGGGPYEAKLHHLTALSSKRAG